MPATLVREKRLPPWVEPPAPANRERQAAARARTAVLRALAAFVICQIGLRVFIEKWHRELRDTNFEIKYNQFSRQVAKCATPPAVVAFLGSSMTAHGVRADILEAPLAAALGRPVVAFNFGTSNAGPLTHLMSMQRLLRRGIRPDLVVVELSPLLHDCPNDSYDLPRFPASMLDHADLATIQRYNKAHGLTEEWWQAFLVPLYGHRLTILSQWVRNLVPYQDQMELWKDMDEHGWHKLEVPAPEIRAGVPQRVTEKLGPRLRAFKEAPVPLQMLHELAALLKEERIPAVFVQMPEGPLLGSLYNQEALAKVLDEFADLSRSHEIPMVRARAWMEEEMFTDSYHMTHVGAEKFMRRLQQEAILPLMTKGAGKNDF